MKCCIALICSLLLSTQVLGAQTAVILGPDLEPKAVTLHSLTPESIRATDAQGAEQRLKLDDVLRLTFARASEQTASPGHAVVTLRDGQVLVGKLIPPTNDEAVRLKLDDNRSAQVPLDLMMSLRLSRGAAPPAVEDDDALLLATGEVLKGFVETVGAETIGFIIGEADDPIEIPLERIEAVTLANKPVPIERDAGLVRVELSTGAVFHLKGATLNPDGDVLVGGSALPIHQTRRPDETSAAASTLLSLPLASVRRIDPISPKRWLTSLTAFEMQVVSGGEVFGVKMLPRVEVQGRIRLHAPTTLGFDLPKGASRVAFTAALDLGEDIPEARRQLAGCELIVYEGDKRIGGCTLTEAGPPQRLNFPLSDGQLRIELDPGVNGPVLDRVILTDAELLVSE